MTEDDENLAREIALERNSPKEKVGIQSRKIVSGGSELQTHLVGTRAEVAVAILTNGSVNRSFGLSGDDDQGDVLLPNRMWAEVKFRRARQWDFALRSNDPLRFKVPIGFLVWPGNDKQELDAVGAISRKTFLENWYERDYGHGPRAVVDPKFFAPMETVLLWLEKSRLVPG